MEERGPVDVLAQRGEREIGEHPDPGALRESDVFSAPGDRCPIGPRRRQRDELVLRLRVDAAELLVVDAVLRHEGGLALVAEQARGHGDSAAGVEHVHDRLAVVRGDLHGGVRAARRRAADEQGQLEALALHLARHVDHFVERGSDEAAQPDQIGLLVPGPLEDLLARDHDAHVNDVVVVAGQHHADDVLADVVNVALHRGQDDLPLRLHDLSGGDHLGLFSLHEGGQVGDSLLHHPR